MLARPVAAMLVLLSATPQASLAQSLVWTDIACSESRLVVADNFRCRATDAYSPGGGSAAKYRFYTATTSAEGMTYLYLMEGLDDKSWIRLSRPLPEQLSQSIPLAQSGKDWSAVRLHAGSGYALFTAENGANCMGFRKPGPDRGAGYGWAILGIRCAPKGQALNDSEIVTAIESARTK